MAAAADRIVLVGLPGAGKSTVGPLLAARLGWRFIDLDQRIEAEAGGLSVPDIFRQHGEACFRGLERELTARLASESRFVLSAGGGWMVHNRLPNAIVVWLKVDPRAALHRVGAEARARPLLAPDPAQRLRDLLAEREQYYRRADIHIETDGCTPADVAAAVAAAVESMHGKQER